MDRKRSKILSLFLIFTMLIGMVGIINVDPSYAATKKKKITNKITISKQPDSKYDPEKEVWIKWNKIKSPDKGFAVFRDGVPIVHLTKNNKEYLDMDVKPGTTYKYQVKTFKVKKVKKYYNKRTGKWQTKKPKKADRGKSKKVKVYTYKKKSNVLYVTTKSVDPKVYGKTDIFNILTYVGNAVDWSENMITDQYNWDIDNYSAYSVEINNIKSDTKGANAWLKAAQKITGNKYPRNCTKSDTINAGYTTWDGMLSDIIAQCNYIESANVSSMSSYDRMSYAVKVLTAAKAINIAYLEIYGN